MRRVMLAIAILLMIVIAVAPTTAQTLDNSGGGTWKEYMSFPITTVPTEFAQYKIVINGTIWEIYNVTGALKASGINDNFWSLVSPTGDDIRVFNQNAQLYFWIEEWDYVNQTATIWANLTSGSTELNVAYGNPSALPSAYNDATKVFVVYDDFEDGVLSNLIQIKDFSGSATVTEANGVLTISNTGAGAGSNTVVYFNISCNFPIIVETVVTSSNSRMGVALVNPLANYYVWHWLWLNDQNCIQIFTWDTGATIDYTYSAYTTVEGNPYLFRTTFNGDTVIGYVKDLSTGASHTVTYTNTSYSFTGYSGIGAYGTTANFEYIRVYKLADPANFGAPLVMLFQKQFGTKTVYVNVTYLNTLTTTKYNPAAYYKLEDKPLINITSHLLVTGVNTTYGANISIELISFVTLDKVVYNGTDVTANLTYQGTITNSTTGYVYNVYTFTTYENGTLEIYGHVSNKAYETTYKLDGELVDIFNTTAIIGELLEITLTHKGNITVASTDYTGVTSALVNTKDLGVGVKTLTITIEDPENYTVGYKYGIINISYGNLNVLVRHKDLTPFTNAIVSVLNENYNILSTDLSKLYAGTNTISVFFHGIKLKSVTFYLNHTTNGASIKIDVNSTRFTDYRGVNRTIASPNSFEVVNLSADYPYSVIEIRNYSGTVVIDYEANPPTAVNVEGADLVEYIAPVLKFSGSGNATITDLYKLTVNIKDRLGNPLNFYVTVNGSKVEASKGIATKLLKPSWYEVVAPTEVNGFKLWKFNSSNNVALVEVNTSDVSLSAEYRVPTAIETKEVRIESLFGWLPIPFLSPKQEENVTIVRLEGTLKDFYGAPVANKTIKIEIASPKFTRIYNVTTDSSGNFKLEVDMAKGVEYKVTYSFEGDDVYVETSTSKTFLVEQLLPAPPAPAPSLLIVVVVVAIGAGVVTIVYMAKKKTAVARTRIEEEFRFFRRLK